MINLNYTSNPPAAAKQPGRRRLKHVSPSTAKDRSTSYTSYHRQTEVRRGRPGCGRRPVRRGPWASGSPDDGGAARRRTDAAAERWCSRGYGDLRRLRSKLCVRVTTPTSSRSYRHRPPAPVHRWRGDAAAPLL